LNPKGLFAPLLEQNGAPRGEKSGRWLGVLAFLLAVLFLYLALRELDWQAFGQIFRQARYALFPVLFTWASLSYAVRARRWQVLLEAQGKLRWRDVFWANMAGYLGNMILPARAGEVVRAGYLSMQKGLPFVFILSTGMVERLMDVVSLVVLGAFSLAITGILPDPLRIGLTTMAVLGMVGCVVIFFLPRFEGMLQKLIAAPPWLGEDFKTRIWKLVQQILRGFQSLANPRRAAHFLLLTGVIWLMDGLGVILMAYMLNLSISLWQAFVLLAGIGLSSAIPSTPGYVGVYQYAAVLVLAPFGFSAAQAVALMVFNQANYLLILLVWGGSALWVFSKRAFSSQGV
jgi:uncharacterized protein (TIRG00374 family)